MINQRSRTNSNIFEGNSVMVGDMQMSWGTLGAVTPIINHLGGTFPQVETIKDVCFASVNLPNWRQPTL